ENRQRIRAQRRLVQIAAQRVGDTDNSLSLLRRQNVADNRDRIQESVDPVHRRHGALEGDLIALSVDIAVRRDANRGTRRARVVNVDDIATDVEGNANSIQHNSVTAHQIEQSAWGTRGEETRQERLIKYRRVLDGHFAGIIGCAQLFSRI